MSKPIENPALSTFLDILKDENRYVIPDYQREYTWRNEDKWRLIETIINDMNEDRKVTFLGGIILSQGEKSKLDTPYDIVDGQQRTITIIFLFYCLYKVIDKILTQELNDDLKYKNKEIAKHLKKRCSKIQREGQAQDAEKYMVYILINLPKDEAEEKTNPSIDLKEIDKIKLEEDFLVQSLAQALGLEKSFEFDPSSDFDKFVEEEGDRKSLFLSGEKGSQGQSPTFVENILAFYEYLTDRVEFIQTTVQKEYAYDVFERFNTAGDPLTAFETFKPLVMSDIKDKKINNSCRGMLEKIEENLRLWSDDDNKTKKRDLMQKNTQNFVIWFAYYFSGGKKKGSSNNAEPKTVEKSLHMQREYLRSQYKPKSRDEKKQMIEKMMYLSEFINQVWAPPDLDLSNFTPADSVSTRGAQDYKRIVSEAAFGLDFLRSVGHHISIPLMAYFFEQFQKKKSFNNLKQFCDVVKSCASFFCLWRSARSTTGSVDEKYRRIYFGTVNKGNNHVKQTKALYETQNGWSAEVVKAYFQEEIKSSRDYGFASVDKWVERMYPIRVGNKLQRVSKFILLLAAHDTKLDHKPTNIFKLSRKRGVNSVLNDDSWANTDYKTLEHIVPVKRGSKTLSKEQIGQLQGPGGDKVLSVDECLDFIESLGNMALIPKSLNSQLKDKPLGDKIQAISGHDGDKDKPHLFSLEFLNHIQAEAFDHKYIKGRTQELARCAWEILAVDWLGWQEKIIKE